MCCTEYKVILGNPSESVERPYQTIPAKSTFRPVKSTFIPAEGQRDGRSSHYAIRQWMYVVVAAGFVSARGVESIQYGKGLDGRHR